RLPKCCRVGILLEAGEPFLGGLIGVRPLPLSRAGGGTLSRAGRGPPTGDDDDRLGREVGVERVELMIAEARQEAFDGVLHGLVVGRLRDGRRRGENEQQETSSGFHSSLLYCGTISSPPTLRRRLVNDGASLHHARIAAVAQPFRAAVTQGPAPRLPMW